MKGVLRGNAGVFWVHNVSNTAQVELKMDECKPLKRGPAVAQAGSMATLTISAVVSSSTVSMEPPCAYVCAWCPMAARSPSRNAATSQGLTLVHFSAQPEPFLTHTLNTPNTF